MEKGEFTFFFAHIKTINHRVNLWTTDVILRSIKIKMSQKFPTLDSDDVSLLFSSGVSSSMSAVWSLYPQCLIYGICFKICNVCFPSQKNATFLKNAARGEDIKVHHVPVKLDYDEAPNKVILLYRLRCLKYLFLFK